MHKQVIPSDATSTLWDQVGRQQDRLYDLEAMFASIVQLTDGERQGQLDTICRVASVGSVIAFDVASELDRLKAEAYRA